MPKTTVHQGANGQFKTTVPKGLAEALDLGDARVEWTIVSGKKMEVKVVDE